MMGETEWWVLWAVCVVGAVVSGAAGLLWQDWHYRHTPLQDTNLHAGRGLTRTMWVFVVLMWVAWAGMAAS